MTPPRWKRKAKVHGPVCVDAQDMHLLLRNKWSRGDGGYVRRSSVAGEQPGAVLLHRLITNAQRGLVVDHINGDVLDNRRCNLRVCTVGQNLQNMRRRPESKTGFKGVTIRKRLSGVRYEATISIDGKLRHLGVYLTAHEAAAAYDEAAASTFGAFAHLNFQREEAA